jgi:hypothetical protein
MNQRLSAILLICASVSGHSMPATEVDPRTWSACLPGTLRTARPVSQIVDPFAPAGAEPRTKARDVESGLPTEVAKGLAALERQIKACLVEPIPVLLLGSRIYRPGERIELPGDAERAGGSVRVLLQRITEAGAELAVWCETPEGVPVQRDALLRAPGVPGGAKEVKP